MKYIYVLPFLGDLKLEKIIEEFNNTVAIKSKLANFIWEFGIITNSIAYFICIIFLRKSVIAYFLLYFIILILLLLISNLFFIKKASKKLGIRTNIIKCFNIKYIRFIYKKIDEFQKDWITKYCKRNKLNCIEKLNILRQEIRNEKESKTIKYINPLIIGTLLISVWEVTIQRIMDKVGFWNMLSLAIVLIIGLSIFIGWIKKIFTEDKEFFVQYEKFSSINRLEELLLYRILKCK